MRTMIYTILSIAIIASPALHAQTGTNTSHTTAPTFDVAAIRQTLTTRGRPRIISSPSDGNFTATNADRKSVV